MLANKTNTKRLVIALLGILVLVALVGYWGGQKTATVERERLEKIWPDFMQWPQEKRAFIVGLAITCKLSLNDDTSEAGTVACLRRGAADKGGHFPKGFDPEQAPSELEKLLTH